ncbi:hypothetical protein JQX13_15825 [Archangium violaceum]|uniref:hypothetical protein n=1 Tax=Archangium violaceum TaxID=83451 RepID=UPI00193B3FF1|nr:hypothetical protein [Archangium violaceum]QRK11406.1 hypothetical protein JQX13_15825 [Archangium violaceum]
MVIDLQKERLRRGMTRYHREPIQTWRRKVKLTLAATALLGLLAGLLHIVLETGGMEAGGMREESSGNESPFRPSRVDREDVAGPAWFTTTGAGRSGGR